MTRRTFATRIAGTAGALAAGIGTSHAAGTKLLVYFGVYTDVENDSKGIYVADFDAATGEFGKPRLAVATDSPSFLEIHPSGKYVYAVGENDGFVSAFAVQPKGALKLLNQVYSRGDGPCHVAIDKTGRMAVVSNYGGGSAASFQIREDGSLSEAVSFFQHEGMSVDLERQEGPHTHSANFSPDNRFVLVCDLGLDKIFSYAADPATGKLSPNGFVEALRGSGPRHLAFHTSGKFVFGNNEMLLTETTYAYDAAKGRLKRLETVSALPKEVPFNDEFSTAETRVHPNGKWVYVSVRTHDTIARFDFDESTGRLTHVSNIPSGGLIPRNFNIDPGGRWLLAAHQDSGNVVLFAIDQTTGELKPTGQQRFVDGCVCVRFLPVT